MRPPTRSTTADDNSSDCLPWQDVYIDVTGPFTRAEGGEQYVLTYLCSKLRVPKLVVLKRLQHGHFSRALLTCMLAARRVPDVIRSDRGPEMANWIMQEITAITNIRHTFGWTLKTDVVADPMLALVIDDALHEQE